MSNIQTWQKHYKEGTPITVLTAYDAQFASIIDQCNIDGILVGDSLRHTFYGESTTVSTTLKHMIYHTQAVANGAKNTFIIADMPFMTYNISIENTLKNATKLIQAGADAIKCEIRDSHIPTIERLIQEGFQVMGHIGLQPQYIHETGGYKLQGTSADEQTALLSLANTLSNIGVFAIVLEKVPLTVAKTITESIDCPTIGIGAGPHCSGQILVTNDMLGLNPDFTPKFMRQFCPGSELFKTAINQFKTEVQNHTFPSDKESYS